MNIVKLGGSLVNPDGKYDDALLDTLIDVVKGKDEQFVFIIGGGKICRLLQDASDEYLHTALPKDQWDLARDEIGIAATKINARYVLQRFKAVLREEVHFEPLLDPTQSVDSPARIFFAVGWKPGHSTDKDTLLLTKTFNATALYKITNFQYVKNVKPAELIDVSEEEMKQKLAAAEELHELTWDQLSDLVGDTWVAGMNTPFDPSAVEIGLELKKSLTAYIGPLEQFFAAMNGEQFNGTVVKN